MEIVVEFFLHLVAMERIPVVFLRIQRKSSTEDYDRTGRPVADRSFTADGGLLQPPQDFAKTTPQKTRFRDVKHTRIGTQIEWTITATRTPLTTRSTRSTRSTTWTRECARSCFCLLSPCSDFAVTLIPCTHRMAQDVWVFVSSHPCMKWAFSLTSLISSSPSSSSSHSSSSSSSSFYPSTSPRLSSKSPVHFAKEMGSTDESYSDTHGTRLRVYVQNVPVCTGTTPTCFTHVGLVPVHTGTFERTHVGFSACHTPHHTPLHTTLHTRTTTTATATARHTTNQPTCGSTCLNTRKLTRSRHMTDFLHFLDSTGGSAWPFLFGGVICLVVSVNERDLCLLKDLCLLNRLKYVFLDYFLERPFTSTPRTIQLHVSFLRHANL